MDEEKIETLKRKSILCGCGWAGAFERYNNHLVLDCPRVAFKIVDETDKPKKEPVPAAD